MTDRLGPALLEVVELPGSLRAREKLRDLVRAIALERQRQGASMGTICGELSRIGTETLRPLTRDLDSQRVVLRLLDDVVGWTAEAT